MTSRAPDIVLSIVLLALGAVALAASGSWSQGAWKFPIVTAGMLVVLGVGLLARSLAGADAPSFTLPGIDVTVFVVLAALYVWLMPRLTFTMSSAAFLFLMAWFLVRERRGRGAVNAAIFAAIATAAVYGLFGVVLGVPLP